MVDYVICAQLILGAHSRMFIAKLDTNSHTTLSFALHSLSLAPCDNRTKGQKKERNITSCEFHEASSTHFPRVFCFVRPAYYSHKFADSNDTQPLNRIYFTTEQPTSTKVMSAIKTQHFINLHPTSARF